MEERVWNGMGSMAAPHGRKTVSGIVLKPTASKCNGRWRRKGESRECRKVVRAVRESPNQSSGYTFRENLELEPRFDEDFAAVQVNYVETNKCDRDIVMRA